MLAAVKKADPITTKQGQPLTAREIQQLLDDDTLLLQYSLGQQRSHLWAVTRTKISHYFLPAREDIERSAEILQRALTAKEAQRPGESASQYLERLRQAQPNQYESNALDLSRLVLRPVWSQLGNKRLVIVADGKLQYIPFEVLRVPKSTENDQGQSQTVLLNNEIVYQQSASTLAMLREVLRPNATKTVAVIADPVFNNVDPRVTASQRQNMTAMAREAKEKLDRSLRDIGDTGEGEFALAKLDYSRREADAIEKIAPRGSSLKAVGFKANRSLVTNPVLKQFQTVHFATHGILNDEHPELSGIVLSMLDERGQPADGFLTLRDIYNLDLPVHLVVLSACRTGVGRSIRGEGLIGLTRGFMYAGAQSLVVSLWRVDDKATAELMTRFYRHMLEKDKLPAAEALRQAKLEMMQSNPMWRAPYYWAGFVLHGDWK